MWQIFYCKIPAESNSERMWKLDNIWQSYERIISWLFFDSVYIKGNKEKCKTLPSFYTMWGKKSENKLMREQQWTQQRMWPSTDKLFSAEIIYKHVMTSMTATSMDFSSTELHIYSHLLLRLLSLSSQQLTVCSETLSRCLWTTSSQHCTSLYSLTPVWLFSMNSLLPDREFTYQAIWSTETAVAGSDNMPHTGDTVALSLFAFDK